MHSAHSRVFAPARELTTGHFSTAREPDAANSGRITAHTYSLKMIRRRRLRCSDEAVLESAIIETDIVIDYRSA